MVKEDTLGFEHIEVANLHYNIGLGYSVLGDYVTALEHHQQSLNIRIKALGETHLLTGISYYDVGFLYSKIGDNDKALECWEKALPILETQQGAEHNQTLELKENFAKLKRNMGIQ